MPVIQTLGLCSVVIDQRRMEEPEEGNLPARVRRLCFRMPPDMATCNDGHVSKQTPAPARLSNRTFVSTVLPDPGSHKRSLSLGDKEISRSSPSPALEQPFRDRSNTLSEKTALPVIRDKYKDLTGEVEVSWAASWKSTPGKSAFPLSQGRERGAVRRRLWTPE